jgi:hypothetical protein
MPTFTVALFGPPFLGTHDMWLGEQYEDEDMEGPYERRPKVDVEATEGETLAVVIDRAADAFRIHPNPAVLGQTKMSAAIGGIAFYYVPTDEAAYRRDRFPDQWPHTLLIPGPTGEPLEKRWQEVTVSELLAASKAGLLYGDPLRPYLCPGFPQGELPSPEWIPPMVDAAKTAADAVKTAAEVSREHAGSAERGARDFLTFAGIIGTVTAAWRWVRRRARRRYKSPWDDG